MNTSSEIRNIESAIQLYFDGLYEGDTDKLSAVFCDKASLFIEKDGELTALPVPQWLEKVANRPAPASQNAPRDDRILMVDTVGPVNAIAKVSCMLPPAVYNDYLSLIKFGDRWQIVAKAYCQVA